MKINSSSHRNKDYALIVLQYSRMQGIELLISINLKGNVRVGVQGESLGPKNCSSPLLRTYSSDCCALWSSYLSAAISRAFISGGIVWHLGFSLSLLSAH